ncbi:MAG: hypothetical protein KAJ95_09500 [Gammaproteobacteria bacterium]|nr:hypothetical protein [Gammaproteobacteria bacterium]
MIMLPESLKAWLTPAFGDRFKNEVEKLENAQLPLQQGLMQSSYVSESGFSIVILNTSESPDYILIKAGIFYAGVIAGSCCADDPTPLDEQTEYCEAQFEIDKTTAKTKIILLDSDI